MASTDMAHHAALAAPSYVRVLQERRPGRPSCSSVSTTRSTHLPQCSGWSPLQDQDQPLLDSSIAANGSSICPSIPGRGRPTAGSERQSGLSSWARSAPLPDPCPDVMLPNRRGTVLPPARNLGHRSAESARHVDRGKLDHATARLYPPRSTAATPAGTPPCQTSAVGLCNPQADWPKAFATAHGPQVRWQGRMHDQLCARSAGTPCTFMASV